MDNKLDELSKPVQIFKHPTGRNFWAVMADSTAGQNGVEPFYSQEYVSALLSKAEADMEIKARLCRESNSLHERLKAAEKRIAELETLLERNKMRAEKLGELLATPVRLPEPYQTSCGANELYLCPVEVADSIRAAGFTFTVEGDE